MPSLDDPSGLSKIEKGMGAHMHFPRPGHNTFKVCSLGGEKVSMLMGASGFAIEDADGTPEQLTIMAK